MGWNISCVKCGPDSTYAQNIVDLIDNHTDGSLEDGGFIKCVNCGGKGYIYEPNKLQEGGTWERHVRGVFRVRSSEFDFLNHYAYLTSNTADGEIDGMQLNYYKDLRAQGGRLKHGHGPGGSPALSKGEFLSFIRQLVKSGWISSSKLREMLIQ